MLGKYSENTRLVVKVNTQGKLKKLKNQGFRATCLESLVLQFLQLFFSVCSVSKALP